MVFDVIYCEQAIFGNYLQPLNTLSNLFFIVIAVLLYYFLKTKKIKDSKSKIFLFFIILTGIGSFLWHFNKNKVTLFFDTIPIFLFIIAYFYFLFFQITKSKKKSISITATCFVFVVIASIIFRSITKSNFINGAHEYILVLLLLVLILIYLFARNSDIFKKLMGVFSLFLLGLLFRQADLLICHNVSVGTHFIWHILVASTLYFAVRSLYK